MLGELILLYAAETALRRSQRHLTDTQAQLVRIIYQDTLAHYEAESKCYNQQAVWDNADRRIRHEHTENYNRYFVPLVEAMLKGEQGLADYHRWMGWLLSNSPPLNHSLSILQGDLLEILALYMIYGDS